MVVSTDSGTPKQATISILVINSCTFLNPFDSGAEVQLKPDFLPHLLNRFTRGQVLGNDVVDVVQQPGAPFFPKPRSRRQARITAA